MLVRSVEIDGAEREIKQHSDDQLDNSLEGTKTGQVHKVVRYEVADTNFGLLHLMSAIAKHPNQRP